MTAPATARIYRGTPRNLAVLARVLRAGGLVAVPTETVYGLAANALDARACRAIFRAKGRPANDPLIVHIHDLSQWAQLAEINAAARLLAHHFWPGPLTMVLPKRPVVPDVVSSGLPSVAVRMPAHRLFRQLLRRAEVPLAAPSANPFGYISPTSAEHVRTSLGKKIRHILDGGPCPIGVESTIVDLRDPRRPRLLRPGLITRDQLEDVLHRRVQPPPRRPAQRAQLAPGLLARHYSPRTPVALHARLTMTAARRSPDEAWVFMARPDAERSAENVFWLSAAGELREAARSLFATLRTLDDGRFKRVHVEEARGGGLADALNDRLRRAAARSP